jgi:hypothetical protein
MLVIESPPSLPEFQFFASPHFKLSHSPKRRRVTGPALFPSPKASLKVASFQPSEQQNRIGPATEEGNDDKLVVKKRKRGYFLYTEDSDYISSDDVQTFVASFPHKRIFHDYIPWYRWGKRSFVLPHERARGYRCPDTDSEPDPRCDTVPRLIEWKPTEKESVTHSPIQSGTRPPGKQLSLLCPTCTKTKNPKVLRRAQKMAKLGPTAGMEKYLVDGMFMLHDYAAWALVSLGELKRSIMTAYRSLSATLRRSGDEPPSKRRKTENGVAIIPQNTYWPPSKPVVRAEHIDSSSPSSPRNTIDKKTPRVIKQYINARYDDFVARQTELGHCVCGHQRRIPTLFGANDSISELTSQTSRCEFSRHLSTKRSVG